MTRLIDADALKTALYYDVSKGAYGEFMDGSEVSLTDREILQLIDEQPTVGEEHGKPSGLTGWICPICGRGLSPFTYVCPCQGGKGWEITCG